MKRIVLGASLFGLAACVAVPAPTEREVREGAAIYGNDDRRDVYDHPDASLQSLARQSIVALMEPGAVDVRDSQDVRVNAHDLGDVYELCDSERFADQPAAAFCSGTLIDDDLVLTAGHCVTSQSDCANTRLVFNYYMQSSDELATITGDDVFSCAELLARELSSGRETLDYAILRLNRPATPRHQPAPVHTAVEPLADGASITIIGFGSGLPAKIDNGGHVIDARADLMDYFNGTTDSFGGNSGSGVFNAAGELVGILVRGDTDYESSGGCNVVSTYDNNGSNGGESISYAHRAVSALCQDGSDSSLCGGGPDGPVCGDGACQAGEVCEADCATSECGDGVCDPGEGAGCPSDCFEAPGDVPEAWSCEPAFYGTLDGCDCECGAVDPDCSQPGQELFNCEPGERCDETATCTTAEPVDPGDPIDPGAGAPEGWECPAAYYGTGDGCHCGCGVRDPDCDDAGQNVVGCTPGNLCNEDGVCASPSGMTPEDLPDDWACPLGYFGTEDGCDCDCGAYDPDCDDEDQIVYNCGLFGVCGEDGACEGGFDLGGGDGDKDVCAVAPAGEHPQPGWALCALLALALARRGRSRRTDR